MSIGGGSAPAPMTVLYEMRQVRPDLLDKYQVFIDGGVTRGTDVLKALCLGARGVGLGRAFLYANSVWGEEGCMRVIESKGNDIKSGCVANYWGNSSSRRNCAGDAVAGGEQIGTVDGRASSDWGRNETGEAPFTPVKLNNHLNRTANFAPQRPHWPPTMNSLTYISRKFDLLAARTPPNTPTAPFADDPAVRHRAAEHTAWSLRSLVAPPPPHRRSLSSPARVPLLRRRPSIRSAIRAKPQSTGPGLFRRLFFIRILELVWHALCTAAASLRVDDVWHGRRLSLRGLRFRRKNTATGKETSADEQDGMPMPAPQVGLEQALSIPESAAKSPVLAHSPSSTVNPLPVSRISMEPPAPGASLSGRPFMVYAPPQSIVAALMPTPPPSRTPTPTYSPNAGLPIAPRKTPFHLPKTLVLDLDETLIHSTSRPLPAPGIRGLLGARRAAHTVEVVMGGRITLYHVYKRPFVDFFLRKVCVCQIVPLVRVKRR